MNFFFNVEFHTWQKFGLFYIGYDVYFDYVHFGSSY